jgi:hypothetical protein
MLECMRCEFRRFEGRSRRRHCGFLLSHEDDVVGDKHVVSRASLSGFEGSGNTRRELQLHTPFLHSTRRYRRCEVLP